MKKKFTLLVVFLITMIIGQTWATDLTVYLKDHSNNLLTGGSLKYFDGSWQDATSTGTGTWSVSTSASSVYYEMTYNNQKQTVANVPVTENPYTFHTVTTTVALKTNVGAPLGGTAEFFGLTWLSWGLSNTSMELLPGNYYFRMTYNNQNQTFSNYTIPASPTHEVLFKTVNTIVALKENGGSTLAGGTAEFYGLTWLNWGAANTSMELLPGNYYFRMTYNNQNQTFSNYTIPVSPTHEVLFTTVLTTVALKTNGGTPLGGTAEFYGLTWIIWGAANTSMELLPGNYYFRMTYNNQNQTFSNYTIPATPTHEVLFKTVKTTISLKTCLGVVLSGGTARYYGLTWLSWGAGNTCKELLPGNYYFEMTYNNGVQVFSNYTISGGVPWTKEVPFITTKVIFNYPGSVQYYQISWQPFVSPQELLPGNYYFQFGSATKQYAISGCIFQRSFITVELRNGSGSYITSGATLRYYDNSWKTDAVNNGNGTFSIETPGSSIYYEMTYNNGKQQIGPYPATTLVITFQTTTTTVRLATSGDIGLSSGVARYYQWGWNGFGTTGVDGNTAAMELLPGNYYFDMTFNNGKQQIGPLAVLQVPHAQTVPFITTGTTIRLETNGGNGLDGGVARFYQWGWIGCGTTGDGGTGNTNVVELLPGNYYFDMEYNNGKQQIGPLAILQVPHAQTVTFKTTATTVRLATAGGTGLNGGVARYYQWGWNAFGTTGVDGNTVAMELLPGNYYFDMTYNYGKQQLGPLTVSGASQPITFTTTATTVRLENCSHTGFPGGVARYYQWGWNPLSNTDVNGNTSIELLPGSYYFDMDFHDGHQQIGPFAVSGNTYPATFTTTSVTIGGTGTKEYYQTGWHVFPSIPFDLLPGNYYFRVDGNQVGPYAVSGCTYNQSVVVIMLKDHNGNGLAGGVGRWYNGTGWVTIGTTPASGKLVAFVNPTNVYYDMKYNNATQQVGPFNAQDYTFQTTLVTLELMDHLGNYITAAAPNDGFGRYHVTPTWYPLGSTAGDGKVVVELLPTSGYYFDMKYHNATQQVGPMNVVANAPSHTQSIVFRTTLVSLELRDHDGNLIASAAPEDGIGRYHVVPTWYSFRSTYPLGGIVQVELLPTSGYYFDMTYHHAVQQVGPMSIVTGGTYTQVITFRTTLVTVELIDHNGAYITTSSPDDGFGRYHVIPTWYNIGSTAGTGFVDVELLPVSNYFFDMTYKYVRKQVGPMSVVTGGTYTQTVTFQTTEVSLNLKDDDNNFITSSSGTAGYYSPTTLTWYDLGSTGSNGYVLVELLQVSGYYFHMTYNSVTQQHGPQSVSGFHWDENFVFIPMKDAPVIDEPGISVYPNPFFDEITINYSLMNDTRVIIKVYNILGKEVAELCNGYQSAGSHEIKWHGQNNFGAPLMNGNYIVKIIIGDNKFTRQVIRQQ